MQIAPSVLAACGSFLIAVLWMDLMFDVQVLRHPARAGEVPEDVLASIAAYYRRVTTTAQPMGRARICRDHLACLAGMLGFVALQLLAAAR